MQTRLSRLVFLLLPVILTSCQTTHYRTDRSSYELERKLTMPNTWQTVVARPLADVHKAVSQGLQDLQLTPITNRCDSLSAVVDGLMADGMDYEIRLKALAGSATEVAIRCGIKGDRMRSLQLFRAAEKHF